MAAILGVGNATLDIIHEVGEYPAEDAEVRALRKYTRRGGNVANMLAVLAQFGHRCAWGGTSAADPEGELIRTDLARRGIDLAPVRIVAGGGSPVSFVLLSRRTGARTIVHYRDLAEYAAADFARLDLGRYDWVHLEARDVQAMRQMIDRVRSVRPTLPISLEVEKPRPEVERLFAGPDLLIFSRHYARAAGFDSPEDFLRVTRQRITGPVLVCPWGDAGARGLLPGGEAVASPAFPPPSVVDTLAAGDVFNAGLIHTLLGGGDLRDGLREACRLAGRKCGRYGLEDLVTGLSAGGAPGPGRDHRADGLRD